MTQTPPLCDADYMRFRIEEQSELTSDIYEQLFSYDDLPWEPSEEDLDAMYRAFWHDEEDEPWTR